MKVNMSKKKLVIGFIAIILILLIVLSVIGTPKLIVNNKIKETEEKISKIDVDEFDKKLKSELMKTSLNINTDGIKTQAIDQVSGYLALVYIDDERNMVNVPCYRLAHNNNGEFVYIEYIDSRDPIGAIVTETIAKVLKSDYDIDLNGSEDYNAHFTYHSAMAEINNTNIKFWEKVYKKLTGQSIYNYSENRTKMYTRAFGIDYEYRPFQEPLDINLDKYTK